jgi:transposase
MDQKTTRPKPRSYTEDYKRQVVDLVVSSGRTSTAVAGEVGLHPTLLCRWVRQYSAGTAAAEALRPAAAPFLKPVPVPTADQAAEMVPLQILAEGASTESRPCARDFRLHLETGLPRTRSAPACHDHQCCELVPS